MASSTLKIGNFAVARSDDAGGFYCAHALYVLNKQVPLTPSLCRDHQDQPLVGFLHIPRGQGEPPHHRADVIATVGQVMRAWIPLGASRFLLTGFGPFGDSKGIQVEHNASGAVVGSADAVRQMARYALGGLHVLQEGDDLVQNFTRPQKTLRRYRHEQNPLDVHCAVLPTDDRAIDGGAHSLQLLLANTQPHAAISLGVLGAKDTSFRVECQPLATGLVTRGESLSHRNKARTLDDLPQNDAMWCALAAESALNTS